MKKVNTKALIGLGLMLIVFIGLTGLVSAVEADTRNNVTVSNDYDEDVRNQGDLVAIDVYEVKINGDVIQNGDTIRYEYERSDELDVRVKLLADDFVPNVEVSAFLLGTEHHTISDATKIFDAEPGVVYTKDLSLRLPSTIHTDSYKLRVLVGDRYGAVKVYNYNLNVDAERHAILIKDVVFSPNTVEAGRALLSVVRLENIGEKDEDFVKVTVSVPELGISASDFIDELEADDQASSEELYMRVPTCAEAKDYLARVTVDFDDGYDYVTKDYKITVTESDACNLPSDDDEEDDSSSTGKTIITVGTEMQDVVKGQAGVVYPISLTNTGSSAKTYQVSVSGADSWASTRVSPSNVVVLNKGETQTVYVYVTANEDASAGEKMFALNIESNGEVVKQVPLTATVSEDSSSSSVGFKKALEVGLIVLIVILIIVGLIVGFSKVRSKEDDDDEEDFDTTVNQTYY